MSGTFPFLAFCAVVVLAYHANVAAVWRRTVLQAANLCFLATFFEGIRAYVPFTAFLGLTYAGLQLIRWRPRQAYVPVLVATIAGFVWLKKYAFVPSAWFLHFAYVTAGLSYILFRILHLMIDTAAGKLRDRVGFVSFFNYTANFLTLASGPIQLYPDYLATEDPASRPAPTAGEVAAAVERVAKGVFNASILSLLLSTLQSRMADTLLSSPAAGTRLVSGGLTFSLYLLFIYCNFAGYMDIVLGVGHLLGVRLPENFNRPFSADNFIEFWGRWHMTLSGWLKAYIYNPLLLTLMRRFPAYPSTSAVLAFFVTFFLVGVWHGQTSEFIFCGLLLGLGVSLNKLYQIVIVKRIGRRRYNALCGNGIYIAASRGLTFTWTAFTLTWFWSSWTQLRTFVAVLGIGMLLAIWAGIFVGSTILLAAWEAVHRRIQGAPWNGEPLLAQCFRTAWTTALVMVIVAVNLLLNQPAPEVVYKAF